MKKECLFGHSFALLEQWEAVTFSLLLYHIQALAFSFSNLTYATAKAQTCRVQPGGVVLGIEMWLFLLKERNRV